MPPPPFTELWRAQELIDNALIRIRPLVLKKCDNLFARRWQADELKVDSPEQRTTISIRRWSQRHSFELRQNEGVDRRQRPIGRSDRWRPMLAQRTKSPVLSTCDRVRRVALSLVFALRPISRIGRADFDPAFQTGHGFLGERPVRWHPQVWVRVANGPDQQTRVHISRDHRRS